MRTLIAVPQFFGGNFIGPQNSGLGTIGLCHLLVGGHCGSRVKIRKVLLLNGVMDHVVSWICGYNCVTKLACFFRALLATSLENFWSVSACNVIDVQLQRSWVGQSLWWVSKKCEHWHQYLITSWEREWRDQYSCLSCQNEQYCLIAWYLCLERRARRIVTFATLRDSNWYSGEWGFSLSVIFLVLFPLLFNPHSRIYFH